MTMKQGNSTFEAGVTGRWCGGLLAIALALTACGDDASAPGGEGDEADAGALDAPESDAGGAPLDRIDAGDPALNGDATLPDVQCDDGLQDNDGDGSCAPACTDAVDCGAGECVDHGGAILCVCDPGFAGAACDACAEGSTGAACDACEAGYVPSTLFAGSCIADPCEAIECGNKGNCNVVDDAGLCGCNLGWAGDTCNVCAVGYTGAACDSCDTGYSPEAGGDLKCIPDVCVSTDCGHGTCTFEPPSTAVCECEPGWDGVGCDQCKLGYLAKDGACVLELPVSEAKLTLHLDMMNTGSYLATAGKEVLLWTSDTEGGGEKNAVYEGDVASAPKVVKAGGLTFLRFDGAQHLRLGDVDMGLSSYSVFIAMDPDASGGATMAPFAAVGTNAPDKHGVLIRSEQHGTDVRYLHRAPIGTSGGDNVFSGAIDDPGVFEPFQVVTAERRTTGDMLAQQLRVDGKELMTTSTAPGLGATPMDLLIGVQAAAGSNPFTGRIGEILVFNGEISLEERAQVEAYLKAKWVPKALIVIGP